MKRVTAKAHARLFVGRRVEHYFKRGRIDPWCSSGRGRPRSVATAARLCKTLFFDFFIYNLNVEPCWI